MGAIEPARQAGSADTNFNHELDHDGFAVGSLLHRLDSNVIPRNSKRSEIWLAHLKEGLEICEVVYYEIFNRGL